MSSVVNIVLLASGSLWPNVHAILDWHRQSGPVRRLFLYNAAGESASPSRGAGDALARWVRETLPEIRVESREGDANPEAFKTQLEAWRRSEPDATWVLILQEGSGCLTWGGIDWLELDGCRVARREPSGAWNTIHRRPGATFEVVPKPDLRRTSTDDLSTASLVRAWIPDSMNVPAPGGRATEPLPLTRLTEAAIAQDWRWREAFARADQDPRDDSPDLLFARYLGGLLHELGIRNVVHGNPGPGSPGQPGTGSVLLWINHAGRLVILDVRLADADSTPGPTQPSTADEIVAVAESARSLAPLAPQWVHVRPSVRLSAREAALARALAVRVLDEPACCELPTQVARLFEVPVSDVAADVERILRVHIAKAGRTRVFAPESQVLREQRAVGNDPVLVDADRWLDQVQHARGQNWLLWTHHDRLLVRVPADNRPDAAGDWGLLLAVVTGLDRDRVQSYAAGKSVVISLPDQSAHRRRLADWFRPFLNAEVSFAAAQQRLAAEARVHGEPPPVEPSAPRRAPPAAPKPRPTPSRAPAPQRRSELSDLDRALDDALGRSNTDR